MSDLSGLGGAVAAVAALLSFIVAHELGHFLAAKATGMKVTEFFIGFGPRIWSLRRGETEYGIKPIPLGAYVKVVGMHGEEEVSVEDEPRAYRSKPLWAKSVVVLSGVAINFLIAYLIFFSFFLWKGVPEPAQGRPIATTEIAMVVAEFEDQPTAASVAGLAVGDRVVGMNGRPIETWDELIEVVGPLAGETVEITVVRDGEELTVPITPGARIDGETGEVFGFLGVSPEFLSRAVGPVEAGGLAASSLSGAVLMTFESLGEMLRIETVTNLLAGLRGAEVPIESRPVSPVGMAQIGAQASEFGLENAILMMALVNVFLGTFNALPLFPLDGGHFVVAVIEKVIRRPVNMRYLMPVAVSVIVAVASLGLLALALDILQPIDL